jgi:hypothetical protein
LDDQAATIAGWTKTLGSKASVFPLVTFVICSGLVELRNMAQSSPPRKSTPGSYEASLDAILEMAKRRISDDMSARQKALDEYLADETDGENNVRLSIDALVAYLGQLLLNPIDNTNDCISYQLALCASFVRTHFLAGDCIIQGDLIEGIVLLRKQLESVARLIELDKKPLAQIRRVTPNVKHAYWNSGRWYGILSQAAHVADPEFARLLKVIERGSFVGPTINPAYTPLAKDGFRLHCFIALQFTHWLITSLGSWHPHNSFAHEAAFWLSTYQEAIQTGIIEAPEDTKDEKPTSN